jgi:outer membrane protein, heavy metal efflux system
MRWLVLSALLGVLGCQVYRLDGRLNVEADAVLPPLAPGGRGVGGEGEGIAPSPPTPLPQNGGEGSKSDLAALWQLALAQNPSLREAEADLEAARARQLQASKYPNPRIAYSEDVLGSAEAPPGNISVQVTQEIVTAGKRRLDVAVAAQDTQAVTAALLARKFEVLTRIRRGYYDYLAWAATVRVNDQFAAWLRQAAEVTRQLVEVGKTRPRSDLLRLQALLEQARIGQTRSRINLDAAWKQLAADVGLPDLPRPCIESALPEIPPAWEGHEVLQRVLGGNAEVQQAAFEAARARLEWERARAEAVPNVQVGGGWTREFVDHTGGAIVSVETALPLWDRKQGHIHEAEARWMRAQASERTTANRLTRETAEALARYHGARQQVERLSKDVLPQLEEALQLVRQAYQAGDPQQGFADVQLAVETLNDARLKLVESRRELWLAVADLQGLMQFDVGEELPPVPTVGVKPAARQQGRCEP